MRFTRSLRSWAAWEGCRFPCGHATVCQRRHEQSTQHKRPGRPGRLHKLRAGAGREGQSARLTSMPGYSTRIESSMAIGRQRHPHTHATGRNAGEAGTGASRTRTERRRAERDDGRDGRYVQRGKNGLQGHDAVRHESGLLAGLGLVLPGRESRGDGMGLGDGAGRAWD